MFTFVHAADLHLDTPFKAVASEAPDIARELIDASLVAWDQLVTLTIEQQAVFLLIAGDVYDGAERGMRAQFRFRDGLERLSSAGIATFVIHGNHDPLDGWSGIKTWPSRVTVFGHAQPEAVPVVRDGQRLATIYGMSYPTRDVTENLALRYKRTNEPGLHIAMLHCNLGSNPDYGSYSPCSLADLRLAGMDYWALGHIHQWQVVNKSDPWVVYPGSLQGRSPKPSERGAKGAAIVHCESGQIADVRFAPVDRARFITIEVDAATCRDMADVTAAFLRGVEPLRQKHPERGLVVRAHLRGRTPLHRDLSSSAHKTDLLRELRDEVRHLSPFFWWESLEIATKPEIDRDAIRARPDFPGEFVKRCDALRRSLELETLVAELMRGLPAKVKRHNDELAAGDFATLFEDAELLALDLLEGRV